MSAIIKDIKHLARHTAIYGVTSMLAKAIGFLLIPLYTHYIPPDGYGVLELLDISINIIGMFVGLGLANSVARFYYASDSEEERKQVVSSALIILIILTSLMLVLLLPCSDYLAGLLFDNRQLGSYVRISLYTFALNAVLEIPLTLIRAREQSLFFSVISLFRLVLSLFLNIYFIVVLQLGILGFLYSGLITSSVVAAGLVLWCLFDCGLRFHHHLARQMMVFGAPLILSNAGMFIINFGDRFVLKESAGLDEVGIYSLSYKIGMSLIAMLIQQPFYLIWSCRQYSLIKEEGGIRRYGMIFYFYALFLLSVWLILTTFAKELIMLVAPPSYYPAWHYVPFIALGYVLRALSDFFRGAFMIRKRTSLLGSITLIVAGYCVLSYIILIPRYLTMGAALATLSTFFVMIMVNGCWAVRIMPEIDYRLANLTRFSLLIFLLAFFLILCNSFHIPLLLLLVLKCGILAGGLFAILKITLTREEQQQAVMAARNARRLLSINNHRSL